MDKPKKRSRWVKDSGIPRFDKPTEDYILNHYREGDGWKNGAKVYKRPQP